MRAGLDLIAAVGAWKAYLVVLHGQALEVSVGVHYGPAVVGALGSGDSRIFTAIGDTVNTAARIEQANRAFGTSLLVSEAVVRVLGEGLVAAAQPPVALPGQEREPRALRRRGGAAMSLAFTVWGARGSMAVSGPGYLRYGGDTSCYHVEVEPGHHLLIDCGTGLRSVESRLGPPPLRFTVLFTHYHLDHLQGLPVFSPLYDRANQFHFYGARYGGVGAAEALHLMLRAPLFPVPYDEVPALCRFSDLSGPLQVGPVRITTLPLRHPGGATGFRLEGGAGSVVLITDHEAGDAAADEAVVAFAAGADVLLHDSQYTRDQLEGPRAGWGHSSFAAAATVAARAGVGRLVLTSHDPDRRDDELDAFVAKVRRHFPATEAAYPGLAFPL